MSLETTPELADVLDSNGNPTGELKTKNEIFRDSNWRIVTHIWVVDPGTHELVVQQRASEKGIFDGFWDVSVGGGVQAGELTVSAAKRELAEELGIEVEESDLILLGRYKVPKFIPERQQPMNEYSDTYLVKQSVDLNALVLEPSEVAGVKQLALESLVETTGNPETYRLWVPHSPEYYAQVAQKIAGML